MGYICAVRYRECNVVMARFCKCGKICLLSLGFREHTSRSFNVFQVQRLMLNPFCPQLRQLPESVIVETTEYKCLQSQFSVLYNDSMQLKTQLEETRHQLQTSKNAHLRQIEQMEVCVCVCVLSRTEFDLRY